MQVDRDREEQLDMHLERTLKSLYSNTTSDKATQYYNYLNEKLEESCLGYLIENQRKKHIIYLKGLVERKKEYTIKIGIKTNHGNKSFS